jgi:mRNA-degrading endonuclease RelE of RelBE toxin-antitoxin system
MITKPKLEKTTDYEIFELHQLNRPLHESKALVESMKRYGFQPSSPIHVTHNGNGKYKVKRGHHRLAVAKKLGLPVWYIVDDDPMSIYEWESDTNTTWSIEDFAHSYANSGSDDCCTLLDFQKKHKLTLGTAAALVGGESAGSNNKIRKLRSGKFRVGDMTHAHIVAETVDFCRDCGVAFAGMSSFVEALSAAIRVPEFDVSAFRQRVHNLPKKMTRRSNKKDYLTEIEDLYNFRAHGKRLPLAIRAKEVADARRKTFGKSDTLYE